MAKSALLEASGIPSSAWSRTMRSLVDAGLVERSGRGASTRYLRVDGDDAPADGHAEPASATSQTPADVSSASSVRDSGAAGEDGVSTSPVDGSTDSASPSRRGRFDASVTEVREILGLDAERPVMPLLAPNRLPHELWATVSGYANGAGGYVLLGATGRRNAADILYLKGTRATEVLIGRIRDELLAGAISHLTGRRLEIWAKSWRRRRVIVVAVPGRRASDLPVYVGESAYGKDPDSGTFVTEGSGVRAATEAETDGLWDEWASPHRVQRDALRPGEDDVSEFDALDLGDGASRDHLLSLTDPARRDPTLPLRRMRELMVRACGERELDADALAVLLQRDPAVVSNELALLVERGRLEERDGRYVVHRAQL